MYTPNSRQFAFVRIFLPLVLVLTLALSSSAQLRTGIQPADLILHNGVIWTGDSKTTIVQAVAIRDGKFAIVGSNRDA